MSRIEVDYNGKTYVSTDSSEPIEDIRNAVYEIVDGMSKFQMELQDGGYFILGQNAVKSCVFKVIEQ